MGIRDRLERNKIFIETFTTVALMIVAIMAGILSWQANQIASYQTAIMELEHQPILQFKINFDDDPHGYPCS